jgi:Flp pilus assembly protein TadD
MRHVTAFRDRKTARFALSLASMLALTCATGLGLGGCNRPSMTDITGSIGGSDAMPKDEAALRQYSEEWGRRYDSDRNDKRNALNYARALRALDQHAQAVAVLQAIAVRYPRDLEVLGAYGKALADAGRLQQAAKVLENAHSPERPNWSILSAQGSVADQMGDHAQAQGYYGAALKIRPNDPTVLSNLGLSYALARDLPQAEATLRTASDQPSADVRIRQNLALVLALQGKFAEAEEVSRRDLSAIDASANVASIRRMIAQSNTWRDIKQVDLGAKTKAAGARSSAPGNPGGKSAGADVEG